MYRRLFRLWVSFLRGVIADDPILFWNAVAFAVLLLGWALMFIILALEVPALP